MRGRNRPYRLKYLWFTLVGAEGFEPPTLCSQSRCATRLRYAPTLFRLYRESVSPGIALQAALLCAGGSCRHLQAKRGFTARRFPKRRICSMLQSNSIDGGYSSAAERLTVAQDVVGSIPTSRPIQSLSV